jgi:hypothetical protein
MKLSTRMVVLNSKKYVLDLISAVVAAAYSLRRLYASYTGAAIRVRRSSDNAEKDIGFIGEHLDVLALLVFVGNGNGFVTTWYDQSGNGRHATQVTAANQPQIVASGAVITEGGRPAITHNGTSQRFDMPSIPFNMNAISVNVVAKLNNTSASGMLFASPDPNRVYVPFFNSSSQTLNVGYATSATAFGFGGSNLTDRYLWQLNAGASTTNAWRNGVASTAVASSSAAETGSNISIGSYQKMPGARSIIFGMEQRKRLYCSHRIKRQIAKP